MRPHRPIVRAATVARQIVWPAGPLAALLVLALVVLVAGCGAASETNGSSPATSAHAVHEAWVAAVRNGDADAALDLADPEMPERMEFARDAVHHMHDYLVNPAGPTGELQAVTVEPVVDGVGRSVWQFARKRWCYRAELVSRGNSWYVSRWGQTSVDCPSQEGTS